ncbi:MAG: hypothetical protein HY246_02100 [Proteobacteria bacterium]|nr:hypothetical protein [Pseudomonadota bacterium]
MGSFDTYGGLTMLMLLVRGVAGSSSTRRIANLPAETLPQLRSEIGNGAWLARAHRELPSPSGSGSSRNK